MNIPPDERPASGADERNVAASRRDDINAVTHDIRKRLIQMAEDLKKVTSGNLNDIIKQIDLLHAAHVRVVIAEDKFNEKFANDPDADAIDFDAIRDEIGRQLDRLRAALPAEGISGPPD